jgi:hypothetical protein
MQMQPALMILKHMQSYVHASLVILMSALVQQFSVKVMISIEIESYQMQHM